MVSGSLVRPDDVPQASSALSTASPPSTSPKIVCLPSSQGVGTNVRKNWLPSVPGPEFAMLRSPPRSCWTPGANSPSKR
jgi:hypothetical protein